MKGLICIFMSDSPCFNCTDRTSICHSECTNYKNYVEALHNIQKLKDRDAQYYSYAYDMNNKRHRRRR